MNAPRTKLAVLEEEFLPLRARILEIAAGLDRLDRAAGVALADPRKTRLLEAIDLLASKDSNRAEQVQLLFSRPYEKTWRKNFEL